MTFLEMCGFVFVAAFVAAAASIGAHWLGWPGGVLGAGAAIAVIYGFIRLFTSLEENPRGSTQSTRRLEFICFCLTAVLLEAGACLGIFYCFRHLGVVPAVLLAPLVLIGALFISWLLADVVTSFVVSGSMTKRVIAITVAVSLFVLSWVVLALSFSIVARKELHDSVASTITSGKQRWTIDTQLNPDGTRIALISDANNQVVFTGSLRFSDYSRWFVHGGEGDFWIYSGDIGVLHFTLHPDGTWRETSARSSSNGAMPRAFYEALPESTRRHVGHESIGP